MKKGLILFAVALVLGLWITSGGQQNSRLEGFKVAFSQNASSQISQNLGVDMDFGRMPVYFTANEGQMDERVAYYINGKDKQIYFTQEGVTFVLIGDDKGEDNTLERWVVKLEFTGADKNVSPKGEEETGAVISYFKGRPEEWRTGIATYARVVYANLWPGIDLVYRGAEGRLKYAFVVHPGADPGMIRMVYRGASQVTVTDEGELEIKTPLGGFADGRPNAYQEEDGKRVDVGIEYDLKEEEGEGSYSYGFRVGEYDRSQALILDPAVLIYCGYIGGTGDDSGKSIAVDGSGSVYITGWTESSQSSFPVVVGPDLSGNGGVKDAFVAKVNSAGTGLVYCGYIGGSGVDYGYGIVVDGFGNAYITGITSSIETSFPVTGGPDLTYNGGIYDAFVAKVNSAGTGLSYCGYIGGTDSDSGKGIAVDSVGSVYITGWTQSSQSSFPVVVGPDLSGNGGIYDAFVAKVNSAGTGLVYCGYIGGSDEDGGNGIAVDGFGNAYITGITSSIETSFPVTVGPDLTFNGQEDAFVAKVNSAGTDLVYCGYIGGSYNDYGNGIAVDGFGSAYVTGAAGSNETKFQNFPVTGGPDLTYNGSGYDAFVAKLNFMGTDLVYCGYIGGSDYDYGNGIAVDGFGNAFVIGYTESTEASFPETVGPDLNHTGGYDAFVTKVNSAGTQLVYCGYIGGTGVDYGYDIAVDGFGNAYVTGETLSSESSFPVTVGPDTTYNGGAVDAFVAKIHHYTGKNDFNSDGQEDILWRHYGTGGNALWYIDSSGATAGLSQEYVGDRTMGQGSHPAKEYQDVLEAGEILYKDERVFHDVLDVNAPYKKALVKAYWDALKAGDVLNQPGEGGITGDTQELMNPGNQKARVQTISVIGTEFLPVIVDTNWRIVGTGDFNRDGNVDILWRHLANGQNSLWYMTGQSVIGTANLIKITDVNWQIVGTGDFNRDGYVDILWRHYGTGQNVLWYMNGHTNIGTAYLSPITDVNWRIEGTGDFNRDGYLDILWRHYGTGQNALWYMSGSTLTGTAYLSPVADVYWGIEGIGDFNGDGKVDILWRHYVYGSNSLWYMNGNTLIGTETLLSVPDVNWRIENH